MLELLNVCQSPARLRIVVCVRAKRILDIRLWVCNLFSHNKLINTHSHAHMHKVNPFLWVNNGRPEISSQKTRHQPPNNTYTLTLWPATQSSELSVCISLSFSLSLCLSPATPLCLSWIQFGLLGRRLKRRQSYQHLCKQWKGVIEAGWRGTGVPRPFRSLNCMCDCQDKPPPCNPPFSTSLSLSSPLWCMFRITVYDSRAERVWALVCLKVDRWVIVLLGRRKHRKR